MVHSEQKNEASTFLSKIVNSKDLNSLNDSRFDCTFVEEISLTNNLCTTFFLTIRRMANKAIRDIVGEMDHEFAIWQ